MSARQVSHRDSVQAGTGGSSILILSSRAAISLGLSSSTRRRGRWCPAATLRHGYQHIRQVEQHDKSGRGLLRNASIRLQLRGFEPSSGGYESPPIEQSPQQADPVRASHRSRRSRRSNTRRPGYALTVVRRSKHRRRIDRPPTISSPVMHRLPTRPRRTTRRHRATPRPVPNSPATRRPTPTRQPMAGSRITAPRPIPTTASHTERRLVIPPPSSYPATGYSGGYGQPQAETNQFALCLAGGRHWSASFSAPAPSSASSSGCSP